MKIYFGFTVAGDRSGLETRAQSRASIGGDGTRSLDSPSGRRQRLGKRIDRSAPKTFTGAIWLGFEQCDLFIAEVSGSSFGLGFETGYLLGATNKKVVLLYRREVQQKVSLLITGNTHPNCTLVTYTTVEEVEQFVARNIGR